MVTIFGYGAPISDTGTVALLKKAWGDTSALSMEKVEIIDVRNEDDLIKTWSPYIHSHHYRVESCFYGSWIANHPLRTGEAYINQFIEAMFIDNNKIPKHANFNYLWDWYEALQDIENTEKTYQALPRNIAKQRFAIFCE